MLVDGYDVVLSDCLLTEGNMLMSVIGYHRSSMIINIQAEPNNEKIYEERNCFWNVEVEPNVTTHTIFYFQRY